MAVILDTITTPWTSGTPWRDALRNKPDTSRSLSRSRPTVEIDIRDIRSHGQPLKLASEIRSGLQPNEHNECLSLPSLLLWNEQGLKHFEEVTYTSEYYLTDTEIAILRDHSAEIASNIEPNTILLELGSGSLRKIDLLLKAIESQQKRVDYYALDLDRNELERTLRQLDPTKFKYVHCHGLVGTYDDGRNWISRSVNAQRSKCVISLGSTIGSFTRSEAGDFWRKWSDALKLGHLHANDMPADVPGATVHSFIIIGLDGCKDKTKVWKAYNDEQGANSRFILNTLDNANEHLGYQAFDRSHWVSKGEWNGSDGRHEQYLVPLQDVHFENVHLPEGGRIFIVSSHKYDEAEKVQLWRASGLNEMQRYTNRSESYGTLL